MRTKLFYLSPLLLFMIGLYQGFTKAQSQEIKCPVVQGTFCLVRISVWPKEAYPIFMDGLSRGFDCQKLNLTNTDSLFNSFYRQATFTPQFPNGITAGICACMGDTAGRKYYNDNNLEFSEVLSEIEKYSSEKKLKLMDGTSLIVNSVRVIGEFYSVDKNSKAINLSSNQANLKEIHTIDSCYIPFSLKVVRIKKR
jgi:hypothetical protein